MGCSRLSVQREREEGEVGRWKGERISSLSPFSFCSSRLNESHKGDNSSGHLLGTFAFAHGTSPDLSFPLLRREGKRGAYHWFHPPLPPFHCNPWVWGFTIVDFWYIIFLTPYNVKVCGIAVLIIFHVDCFAVFCPIAVSG